MIAANALVVLGCALLFLASVLAVVASARPVVPRPLGGWIDALLLAGFVLLAAGWFTKTLLDLIG